jgi:RNA recognition motif-containing protein
MKSQLFVGNLSTTTEEADLRNAFCRFGELLTSKMVRVGEARDRGDVIIRSGELP